MSALRKYLIAGLLVWLPLGVTVLVLKLLVDVMDRTLLLLPSAWRPDALLGFHIPGLGLLLSLAVVGITGVVVANLLGRRLVAFWESFLSRIPLVRSIYLGVKQVVETVFSSSGKSFRKVVLIEYPRRETWCLAFLTGSGLGEVQARTGQEVVAVFVPTTPNPTSGFVLLVPTKDVRELDMSIDDGLKLIISMGVAVPKWTKKPKEEDEDTDGATVERQDPKRSLIDIPEKA
uniref:Uncharacterized membrane protein n=1 Tax=Candidatus Kentrum sp. SD TaxID=2126332 RepID=A0A450YIG2_9GAMM|nr:MAG: Uncharacterized membrane protein [Candidatus Kentron sp. SD]VFK46970.1 MAG: Uncharacterized membrane protein [Candidatus Kentron sp. SD]VFK79938.1 MAG: Uncharacterized membrane protein [Candidatus Kentron sp. SD]